MNRTLNSVYKLFYRFKISFFVFDIIEIEFEFDLSLIVFFASNFRFVIEILKIFEKNVLKLKINIILLQ